MEQLAATAGRCRSPGSAAQSLDEADTVVDGRQPFQSRPGGRARGPVGRVAEKPLGRSHPAGVGAEWDGQPQADGLGHRRHGYPERYGDGLVRLAGVMEPKGDGMGRCELQKSGLTIHDAVLRDHRVRVIRSRLLVFSADANR